MNIYCILYTIIRYCRLNAFFTAIYIHLQDSVLTGTTVFIKQFQTDTIMYHDSYADVTEITPQGNNCFRR